MASDAEVELKMRLNRDQIAAFADLAPILGQKPALAHLHTIYFDDPKFELASRGFELRVRDDGDRLVQTLKRGGGVKRSEWEAELDGHVPSLALAGKAAREIAGVQKRLRQMFEFEVDRQVWQVRRGDAQIEISLDRGDLFAGERHAIVQEAELELRDGQIKDLFDLAADFARQFDAPISFVSKGRRGRRLAQGYDLLPESELDIHIDDEAPLDRAFQQICAACLNQWSANEELLRRSIEMETVHQARIAIRRLRSALSMFKSIVVGSDADEIRSELSWLSDLLGAPRDLDVFSRTRLRDVMRRRPQTPGLDEVEKLIADRRDKAAAELLQGLKSERLRLLLVRAAQLAHAGEWLQLANATDGSARRNSFAAFAEKELSRRLEKITNKRKVLRNDDATGQHRLRIKAKKLKYMIEFVAGAACGRRYRKVARALAKLQKRLGEMTDGVAATRLLGEIAREDGALAFATALVREEGETPRPILVQKAIAAHRKVRKAASGI